MYSRMDAGSKPVNGPDRAYVARCRIARCNIAGISEVLSTVSRDVNIVPVTHATELGHECDAQMVAESKD